MKRVRYSILLAVAAGTLTCDSTDPLTLDQATAVVRAVFLLSYGPDGGTSVKECPLGGEARIAWTSDHRESGDTAWWRQDLVVTPDGCGIEAVGDTLTLDGDPSVALRFEGWEVTGVPLDAGARAGSGASWEGELTATTAMGTVKWQRSDGSSGSCELDLALEAPLPADTLSADEDGFGDLTGLICGHDAAMPLPWITDDG